MPTEIAFDALSRNEQYTSLCFIKFKFFNQTIFFIRKATFQFRELLNNFSHIISTKKYEQYVFKHLVIYVICISISQDRIRLLYKWKIQLQKVSERAWNRD